ncbi:hypothetical protein MANES_12G047043v8 [Manihot esculenta]|uniref:Uncharacterized protein n=1 Tax=Manihot esculenta TaxID=3983 RepID=A0ACB7GPP2_MANES|nr:hypothetical protein MANES_12G047043v8 [Manihot esculenta]
MRVGLLLWVFLHQLLQASHLVGFCLPLSLGKGRSSDGFSVLFLLWLESLIDPVRAVMFHFSFSFFLLIFFALFVFLFFFADPCGFQWRVFLVLLREFARLYHLEKFFDRCQYLGTAPRCSVTNAPMRAIASLFLAIGPHSRFSCCQGFFLNCMFALYHLFDVVVRCC